MLIWHPQAREDLLEIYILVGRENPHAAENLYDSIEMKAEVLSQYPRLGARRANIGPSIRALLDGPYIILYETHPNTDDGPIDTVEVVRVVDGRRDLTRPF